MKSCSVLSLNIVLCWSHLSILLGHSVLESSYSQKYSEVIGKALLSARELQDPAFSPLLISHFFALDTEAKPHFQTAIRACPLMDPDPDPALAAEHGWKGGPGLPACFLESCQVLLPLSAVQDPASLQQGCRSALQFTLLTWAIPQNSRLVPCHKFPLFLSWLEAVKMLAPAPIILSCFFTTSFSLILTKAALVTATHPEHHGTHPYPNSSCWPGCLSVCIPPY